MSKRYRRNNNRKTKAVQKKQDCSSTKINGSTTANMSLFAKIKSYILHRLHSGDLFWAIVTFLRLMCIALVCVWIVLFGGTYGIIYIYSILGETMASIVGSTSSSYVSAAGTYSTLLALIISVALVIWLWKHAKSYCDKVIADHRVKLAEKYSNTIDLDATE